MIRLRYRRQQMRARAINQYWDDVVHRAPVTPVSNQAIPTELGALIRHIQGMESRPEDTTLSADPLLATLLAHHQELNEMNALTASARAVAGRPLFDATPKTRMPRLANALALAGLILLIIGLAVFADNRWNRPEQPAVIIPATPTTPTAISSPTAIASERQTLTEYDLGPDVLPTTREAGDWMGTSLGINAIGAGVTRQRRAGADDIWRGPMMTYVVEGEITILADKDVTVRRKSESPKTVPTGTEAVLEPGDTVMMLEGTALTMTNSGMVTAYAMDWAMYVANLGAPPTAAPEGTIVAADQFWNDHHVFTPNISRIEGPVVLRLERVRIWPHGNVPGLPGVYQLALVVPGQPDTLSDVMLSEILNIGDAPTEVYLLTVQPATSDTGSPGA
jgi:hypothetical protein